MAERSPRPSRRARAAEPTTGTADAAGSATTSGAGEAELVEAEVADVRPGPSTEDNGEKARAAKPSPRGPEGQGTPGRPATGTAPTEDSWSPRPRGLDPDEVRSRWSQAQGGFIDDPQQAVRDAHALASEVADAVVAEIEARRSALSSAWSDSGNGDTESLRLSLREYRAFVKGLIGDSASPTQA